VESNYVDHILEKIFPSGVMGIQHVGSLKFGRVRHQLRNTIKSVYKIRTVSIVEMNRAYGINDILLNVLFGFLIFVLCVDMRGDGLGF